MDDKWFKLQQKRVGVTAEDIARELGRDRSVVSKIYTGQRSMTLEFARKFAEVLQVPLSEVLERSGVATGDDAKNIAPSFAEGDVALWAPREGDRRKVPMVAQALGERKGMDIWVVETGAMSLQGYLPGDYMLVDNEQSERVKGGDVVVAQIYDNTKNRAVTVLRRLEPPVLVAASMDPADRRTHVVDGVNVVIRGKVIASWRISEDVRQPSNHERRELDRRLRENESADVENASEKSEIVRPKRRARDYEVWISGASEEGS
ncbi:helix-turn-helix domain-containing protein [Thioclava nitratireducens]|nr:helix-turn-helix transcriptional regulator [Thioclava nitratireducens]